MGVALRSHKRSSRVVLVCRQLANKGTASLQWSRESLRGLINIDDHHIETEKISDKASLLARTHVIEVRAGLVASQAASSTSSGPTVTSVE